MQPGGQGSALSSSNGVWGKAQPKSNFVHFYPPKLTSSGNDSNDIPYNQLAKLMTV